MIRLSRLADYAVVLMSRMALSEGSVMNAPMLAAATGLPVSTVSKVLSSLRSAGLLVPVRGAHGGFMLAREAGEVSVGAVIAAIDGPVALTDCIGYRPYVCDIEPSCPNRKGWDAINEAVRRALEDVSIADLVGKSCPEPWTVGGNAASRCVPDQGSEVL